MCLSWLWKKFDVRKGGSDHEKRVAILHHFLRRLGSKQPDRSGCIRTRIRHRSLSEQCFNDRSSQRFREGLQFFARPQGAAAREDGNPFSRIQKVSRALDVAIRWYERADRTDVGSVMRDISL